MGRQVNKWKDIRKKRGGQGQKDRKKEGGTKGDRTIVV